MVAEMPEKEKKERTPPPGGDKLTSVKCYDRIRRKIAQLCSLLELNQQDVIARYEKFMDEDLLHELAKRQAELRRGRPGAG